MLKIKQTKRNIMYMIIGRITTAITIYLLFEIVFCKTMLYVIDHCITTIK